MAVANLIAPEHLQLMNADPEALVPLVRHAGAVFCGPLSPASIGDYIAGPSHVLPTFGSARYGSALTVDDFVKQVHVISLDREAFERVAPFVETLADAEGFDAHAESIRLRRDPRRRRRNRPDGGRRVNRPLLQPRQTSRSWPGYHSPQVDVAVRLNTNESPEPPPAAWLRRLRRGGPDHRLAPLSRPGGDATCAGPSPSCTVWMPPRCSWPTARTRCCRRCCSPTAGAGRTAALWEPTYALHGHIGRLTGTAVVEGERAADLSTDLDEVRRVFAEASPSVAFLCSPNNPTGMVDDEATVRRDAGPGRGGRRPAGGRRGLRPVRAVVGARPRRATTCPWW